jgi:hypothetical protein
VTERGPRQVRADYREGRRRLIRGDVGSLRCSSEPPPLSVGPWALTSSAQQRGRAGEGFPTRHGDERLPVQGAVRSVTWHFTVT